MELFWRPYPHKTVSGGVRLIWLGAAILVASFEPGLSEQVTGAPAEACLAANRDLSLGARLPRTSARLKSGEPLLIVAIGSSSTVGLWVLQSSATYPEVMRQELVRLRSNARIEVVNSGRIGDRVEDTVARFNRDVFAHKPDLVVWQLGTNDVAWGGQLNSQLKNRVLHGIQTLKESGADIILMDLQYAPMVLASPYYSKMEAIISEVAREQKIGLFSRFALMRKSIEAGVSPSALVSWDGLHNTADGYDCIGRAIARSVSNTVP
jgi:lysophospholipase L1-like esterase